MLLLFFRGVIYPTEIGRITNMSWITCFCKWRYYIRITH